MALKEIKICITTARVIKVDAPSQFKIYLEPCFGIMRILGDLKEKGIEAGGMPSDTEVLWYENQEKEK
jgi:hypothetical protein